MIEVNQSYSTIWTSRNSSSWDCLFSNKNHHSHFFVYHFVLHKKYNLPFVWFQQPHTPPPPRGGPKKWRSQESRKKNTTKDVYLHLLLYMLVSCVWDICILSLIAWELHIFVGLICCMRDYVYIWCMR